MRKKVLSLALTLAMVLSLAVPAFAAATGSGTCGANGDNIKWSLSGGVLTLSGSGAMRHFEANKYGDPDEVVPWLDQMTKINKVVIGEGITTIGNYAFWGFTNLSSVTIANSVQSIGAAAFYNCTSLTSVKLPDSLTKIDMSAFADCTGLKRVDIPAGVTEVGIGAFIEGNSNLEVHFQGNAPASLGGTGRYTLDPSWGPSFDSSAVLYCRAGTSGWTDSEYYDAAARTWKGYALRTEPGSAPTAYASTQNVLVDGKPVEFQCYALKDANGYDTNYIKVRDLAYVLNGTAAQFNVGWDGSVNLETKKAYASNGTEMHTPFSGNRAYQASAAETKVDGAAVKLESIVLNDDNGGGYTYYKLRDLGSALGFTVDWSAEKGVYIETK